MRSPLKPVLAIGFSILLFSCGKDPRSTGIEYAREMYHSIPLEPYAQLNYFRPTNNSPEDGKHMREPVPGSVIYGNANHYYPYANTNEDYERAGAELKNPLPYTVENYEEGKRLYTQYCIHCHGETGKGDGTVVKGGKYPTPGAYDGRLKDRTDGMIYHTLVYGKNAMGSHASQVNPKERWQLAIYVKTLQGNAPVPTAGAPAVADTAKATKAMASK
jgi:mono/diheme cytochrome c family protein